jgi:hypothetical protein
MTLPATWVEATAAEARAYTREQIALAREPGGLLHPDADAVHGKPAMKTFALSHPFGADEIVYLAENGSMPADEALREIIAEKTDHGEPLGAVLGAYNIRLLNPARRSAGPSKAGYFVRDCVIALLVAELRDRFNLRPTRNTQSKGSRGPSASEIVAEALTQGGIDISLGYKGVERIWQRYMPAFAGTRIAAGSRRFVLGWPADYRGLFG